MHDLPPSVPLRTMGRRLGARALPALLCVCLTGLPTGTASAGPPADRPTTAGHPDVAAAPGLRPEVLGLALDAATCARRTGEAPDARYLAIIDYSIPSSRERMWLVDLDANEVISRHLVAHGVNTGEHRSTAFSNTNGSRQTSLGLFRTAETYQGSNGYSLRLDGLEEGINDLARPRAIVMHGAWYVSDDFVREHGRLGRSWGCPALSREESGPVIDRIQGGHLLFSYYPDEEWLASSRFLSCPSPSAAPDVASSP